MGKQLYHYWTTQDRIEIAYLCEFVSQADIARRFGVSRASVHIWRNRGRRMGRHPSRLNRELWDEVKEADRGVDAYYRRMAEAWKAERGGNIDDWEPEGKVSEPPTEAEHRRAKRARTCERLERRLEVCTQEAREAAEKRDALAAEIEKLGSDPES